MDASAIEQAIVQAIPDAQVFLEGEGCNFTAIVISDEFQDLSLVKRQQRVLQPVSHWISSGALHAFSLKVYTVEEWSNRQLASGLGQVQP